MKSLLMLALILAVAIVPGSALADSLTESEAKAPESSTSSPVTTAFTYQGKLDKLSVPANSNCNFQFSLWDAAAGGTQVGSTFTINGLTVANGLFTTQLDFGSGIFTGNARWLEIAVQCAGDGGFTSLAPRQPLAAAPYAMYALGGSTGITLPYANSANSPSQTAFDITNTATTGLFHGVHGKTNSTTQNACGVRGDGLATSGLTSGVQGYATASPSGTGIVGIGAANGAYFQGQGTAGNGLQAYGTGAGYGVYAGSGAGGTAVYGSSGGTAVRGASTGGTGVRGSGVDYGVHGESGAGFGVFGEYYGFIPPSGTSAGVWGSTNSTNAGSAGVRGEAAGGRGVEANATSGTGLYATSVSGAGVFGTSTSGDGVGGSTSGAFRSGVFGYCSNASGWGGYFNNTAGGLALVADGRAQVKVLEILGADLVEKFESHDHETEPGTVVVIDEVEPGKIRASSEPYDPKVAGVISGANGIGHGIYMGQGSQLDGDTPVAMTGRVYVKCTTENGPIRPGDRLTTSAITGHAMRATDSSLSDGAVIGKAMGSLDAETGLVLVLVNLQ